MEYVDGTSITEYCAEHDLTVEQRLRLFTKVCAAVQYAHQHLVVHRDIKPGNILVTNEGVPKLVDFGIAKLLERGAEESTATGTAMHFMTPEYASPEQVRGVSVTTATDVYSLGVVLYELLSGHSPYRRKNRMPHEIAKLICDEDPERPSAAVATRARRQSGNGANGKVANESVVTLARLRGRLTGDLDNIVLKAMRKEPDRRYASVQQLAEDIDRHLAGLPVSARPDTFGYRAGKFVKRQKVAVTAAALIALTLVSGIIITVNENRIARAERARAERRFNEVRQLANSFVFEVHDAIENLPGSTPARSLIVQRGLKYLDSLAQDAAGDRSLQRELAAAYEKLGTVEYTPTIAHLGDLAGALQSHRKAAALREALVAAEPTNSDYRRELLDSYWYIATLLGSQGDLNRELEMIRQQLPAREELAKAESKDFTDRYNLAGTYVYLGSVLMKMGDINGALDNQQKALRLREQLSQLDPNKARSQRALSISYEYLGLATDRAGDIKSALELQQRGLETRESLVSAEPLNTDLQVMLIESHRYVGDMLVKAGERQQANKHYQMELAGAQKLLASDPTDAQFRSNYAVALIKIGDMAASAGNRSKALESYQRAVQIRQELTATAPSDISNQLDLAEGWIKAADGFAMTGRIQEARLNYLKSLEVLKALSAAIPVHAGIRELLKEAYSRVDGLSLKK